MWSNKTLFRARLSDCQAGMDTLHFVFNFNWEFKHPMELTAGAEINTQFKAFEKNLMQMQLLHPQTEA